MATFFTGAFLALPAAAFLVAAFTLVFLAIATFLAGFLAAAAFFVAPAFLAVFLGAALPWRTV